MLEDTNSLDSAQLMQCMQFKPMCLKIWMLFWLQLFHLPYWIFNTPKKTVDEFLVMKRLLVIKENAL